MYIDWLFSLNIIQANCQLVVKGNNYIPDYAPFAVDKQGKLIRTKLQIRVCRLLKSKHLKVCLTKNKKYIFQGIQNYTEVMFIYWFKTFQIELIKILNIDEVGQIFRNQFQIFMTW